MKLRFKNFSSKEELETYLLSIGNTREGVKILSQKYPYYLIEIQEIDTRAANILKQDAISLRGDCAVPRKASSFEKGTCTVLLMISERDLKRLIRKLKIQPFGLSELAAKIEEGMEKFEKKVFKISTNGKELSLDKPRIMGILNVTPDSFSDGGRYFDLKKALNRAEEILTEGADILDVGGESTRPGSDPVPLEEELRRVIPVIKELRKSLGDDFLISVDTYKSEVAKRALEVGADIVNDISGFHFDEKMAKVVVEFDVAAVVMHIKGKPKDMQKNPYYEDVVSEIIDYFEDTLRKAEEKGIKREKLIIDPGIGFGKRLEDNLCILKRLEEFKILGLPILIGASRKSFIGQVAKEKVPEKRLPGSLAAVGISVLKGAKIVRVHDVKETKQFLSVLSAVGEVNCY